MLYINLSFAIALKPTENVTETVSLGMPVIQAFEKLNTLNRQGKNTLNRQAIPYAK